MELIWYAKSRLVTTGELTFRNKRAAFVCVRSISRDSWDVEIVVEFRTLPRRDSYTDTTTITKNNKTSMLQSIVMVQLVSEVAEAIARKAAYSNILLYTSPWRRIYIWFMKMKIDTFKYQFYLSLWCILCIQLKHPSNCSQEVAFIERQTDSVSLIVLIIIC